VLGAVVNAGLEKRSIPYELNGEEVKCIAQAPAAREQRSPAADVRGGRAPDGTEREVLAIQVARAGRVESQQMAGRQESVAGLLEPRRQACPEEEVARRRPLLSKQIKWGSKLDLPDQPDGWST
jgi:hypothetical protein